MPKTDKKKEVKVVVTKAQIEEFEGFCAAVGEPNAQAPACKACKQGEGYPKGMHDYCASLDAGKAKAKADKKVVKIGGRVRPKYVDFADLKKHVKEAPSTGMSMVLNKLILDGKHTMAQLVNEAETVQAKDFDGKKGRSHFKGVGDIKKHINWLADRGWVVTFTKAGVTKLTDYKAGEQGKTAFREKAKKKVDTEEKKAA